MGVKIHDVDEFILPWKDDYKVLFRRKKETCRFVMIICSYLYKEECRERMRDLHIYV